MVKFGKLIGSYYHLQQFDRFFKKIMGNADTKLHFRKAVIQLTTKTQPVDVADDVSNSMGIQKSCGINYWLCFVFHMIYLHFSIQISRAFGINSGLKVSLQSKMYSLSCRVPRSGHLGNYPLHLLSNGGVGGLENLLIQSLSKKQVLHEHPVTPASAAPELIF